MNKIIIIIILIFSFTSLFSQEEMVNYNLINLDINNKYDTFGTSYYGNDKIVFTASKSGKTFNLYLAKNVQEINEYSLFTKIEKAKTHISNVTFTNDHKTMYFTKSIYGKKNTIKKNKKSRLAIFKATLSANGNWTNIIPMPFNSKLYDVAHPALNKDNSILYFTSNMPGTLGDNDIFEVNIRKDGTFTKPRNLGSNVNTKGKEIFSFISKDNILYFSSNGYKDNYGGLDIYYVKINNSITTKPVHLKDPINSRWDDYSFIFNPTQKTGFLSSDRPGGKGNGDIYYIKESKNEPEPEKEKPCMQSFAGVVMYKNDPRNVVSNAILTIKDDLGNAIETIETRSNARFSISLKCNKNYNVTTSRDGFITSKKQIKTKTKNFDVIRENINLKYDQKAMKVKIISGKIDFSFNDSNLLDSDQYQLEKATILMRQNSNLIISIESHTDSRGNDQENLALSEKRVAIIKNYFLKNGIKNNRIIGHAFGETKLLNKCKNEVPCSSKEHLVNRRTTYKLKEKNKN